VSYIGYIIAGEPLSRRKERFLKTGVTLTPVFIQKNCRKKGLYRIFGWTDGVLVKPSLKKIYNGN
jgi:hypothetical protein